MKRIGLALGSGGAKGLCHIAFIKALDEIGLKPSILAGTSIGALVGAFYAAGMPGKQIEYLLGKVSFIEITKMLASSLLRNSAMLRGKGMEDFIYKNIPARKFEELKIPLKVVATDFWRRKEVVIESGMLIPAIRASMSLPVICEPVNLGEMVLMDGGAVNPLPYDIIRKECDILIAIDVSGEKMTPKHDPVPGIFESVMSTFQIMQASIVEAKKHISKPDIYIKPTLKNIRLLDFDRYDEIMKGVGDDVERFKQEIMKRL